MDIFGMNHLFLLPYEVASTKITEKQNLYTSNDLCLFGSGYNKVIYNILNTQIVMRKTYS